MNRDAARRLSAIGEAIDLVRAAIRHEEWPAVDDAHAALAELARFSAAQTVIAADYLRSSPEAELDDYLSRAADALNGHDAEILDFPDRAAETVRGE